ncbi:hypothetical protein [Microcoleus sp.]|uniref:hypothetical protein n=1 Tax=Microcoleus sp. TaxID=44472 RepID=UPI0035264DCB
MVIGYWLLVIGYWLVVIGYWLMVIGYWLLVIGYELLEAEPPGMYSQAEPGNKSQHLTVNCQLSTVN